MQYSEGISADGEKGKKMPRLIDADALLMDNSWAFYDENGNKNDACIAVENAPTVDAEFVRHGRWEHYNDGYGFSHKCSLCNFTIREQWVSLYDYCPHCGAKMDEVEECS